TILLSLAFLVPYGTFAQTPAKSPLPAEAPIRERVRSISKASPPERVTRIDGMLQQYVDEKRIAGAVALVLRDGKPVYERAVGWSDKEAGRGVETGKLFCHRQQKR